MAAKHKPQYPPGRTPLEVFLDDYWPLWREPKNQGLHRFHDLRAAFDAGQKVKPSKPAEPDCPNWPRCQPACGARGFVNYAEPNDCGRKPKEKQRPRNRTRGDIVDNFFGD